MKRAVGMNAAIITWLFCDVAGEGDGELAENPAEPVRHAEIPPVNHLDHPVNQHHNTNPQQQQNQQQTQVKAPWQPVQENISCSEMKGVHYTRQRVDCDCVGWSDAKTSISGILLF